MLAQDDYTFLLEKTDSSKSLPIELVDRIINQNQEQIIFKVKVMSADKLPVCGKQETVLNIDTKAFRQCTKACFTVHPCPIFPRELTETDEASLEDLCYFFDICIKYITTTPQLRETSFLRNLLCKSAALCIQEFDAVINQDKQTKIATTTKLVTNTAVQQTVDGFKQFGDSMKQLFSFKKNKNDDDITPSPNSDDDNKIDNPYKDLENELAVSDKIIQQQITFAQAKRQHVEELVKQQHKFAVSQAQILSKINKIPNYQLNLMIFPLTEDSMNNSQNGVVHYLKFRQIPVLNIASQMSDKIQQLIDQTKTLMIQEQKLQNKLQKANNQDAQNDLEKIQAQLKQIDGVIKSGVNEFHQYVSAELKSCNIQLFNRLQHNCEEKAGKYKHAIESMENGNNVTVDLKHGCFQVMLK